MKCLALALACGCGPATANLPEGASGSLGGDPSGDTDTDTDNPSGVVWVDADGQVVAEVVELPEGLAFEDEDGFYWYLDPSGEGANALLPFPEAGFVEVGYVDADCEEIRILGTILPPRYVMRGVAQGRSFVAQDSATAEEFTSTYTASGGDCHEHFGWAQGLTYDEVIEATIPDVYWTPPLHPETL